MDINNCRPTAVTDVVNTILQNLKNGIIQFMNILLHEKCITYNVINLNQHGFRENHDTSNSIRVVIVFKWWLL